jgi:hypothetical protein
MTPRWLTIEKLVADLGGVCPLQYQVRGRAQELQDHSLRLRGRLDSPGRRSRGLGRGIDRS